MSTLTLQQIKSLNNSGPEAKGMSLGSKLQEVLVSKSVAVEDAKTTSREENVAGLASAIVLVNSLKTILNAHAADAAEHKAVDDVNFPVATTDATTLATVLTLAGALLTAYAGHDDDSELGSAWVFHDNQETGNHSAVSVVTPTTLQEAVTRLNDLKAKYNAHDADAQTHASDSSGHQVSTADAAYSTAIWVPITNVVAGDSVIWGVLNDGTGNVTGVTAVAGAGGVTFTFSADPQNDTIMNYAVFKTAP